MSRIALALMALSLTIANAFAGDDLVRVHDARTGVEFSVPTSMVLTQTLTELGSRWSSKRGEFTIETFQYSRGKKVGDLGSAYGKTMRQHLRTDSDEDAQNGSGVYSGIMPDGAEYYYGLRKKLGVVRAILIVVQKQSLRELGEERDSVARSAQLYVAGDAVGDMEPPKPPVITNDTAGAAINIVPNIADLHEAHSAMFSPDGNMMATFEDGDAVTSMTVRLWETQNYRPLRSLQADAFFWLAKFTPDSKFIVSLHKDSMIKVWNVATGINVATFNAGSTSPMDGLEDSKDLSIDASGDYVASAHYTGLIEVWSIKRRALVAKIVDRLFVPEAVRISDNRTIFVGGYLKDGSGEIVKRIDLVTGDEKSFKIPGDYNFYRGSIISDKTAILEHVTYGKCRFSGVSEFSLESLVLRPILTDEGCSDKNDTSDDDNGTLQITENGAGTKAFLARYGRDGIDEYDFGSHQIIHSIRWPSGASQILGMSYDLNRAVSRHQDALSVRSIDDGIEQGALKSFGRPAENVFADRRGRAISLVLKDDGPLGESRLLTWQTDDVSPKFAKLGNRSNLSVLDLNFEAGKVLASYDASRIAVFSTKTGEELDSFATPSIKDIARMRLSADGSVIGLVSDTANRAFLVNSRTHKVQPLPASAAFQIAFNKSGTRVAVGNHDGSVDVWDVRPLKHIAHLTVPDVDQNIVVSIFFSADDRALFAGVRGTGLVMWDLQYQKYIRTFEQEFLSGYIAVESAAISPDGKSIAAGLGRTNISTGDIGADHGVIVWDINSGKVKLRLLGHTSGVGAISYSPDGRWLISASYDGTIDYWDAKTGAPCLTVAAASDGRWLAITQAGFFTASLDSDNLVNVIKGNESYSVSQFKDHLFKTDLVAQYLSGDGANLYAKAAADLNLQKILQSGPAPQVELVEQHTDSAQGSIRMSVRIVDTGGGIGSKVVWRVNNKTQGNLTQEGIEGAPSPGRQAAMTQDLRVDPSQMNIIEVVAYNSAGLLASQPLRVPIGAFGALAQGLGKIYILSIGVSKYKMRDYTLHFAADDARAFLETLSAAAKPVFAEVLPFPLIDEEVTKPNLEAVVKRIAEKIQPKDLFVLFVAGHGSSIGGKYFFLQQDLDFSKQQNVANDAVSQDLWQKLLARIEVGKKLLIFDTCESADALSLVRGEDRHLQTAMEQLQSATGEDVIAAARDAAIEGFRNHGVLTSAILETFEKTTTSQESSEVWIDGLASHVGQRVRDITQSLYGVTQEPVRKLSGDNFLLGLQISGHSPSSDCPADDDYVVGEEVPLRIEADDTSQIIRTLPRGFQVSVTYFDRWALLCREGSRLGYVPATSVFHLN